MDNETIRLVIEYGHHMRRMGQNEAFEAQASEDRTARSYRDAADRRRQMAEIYYKLLEQEH